MAPIVFVGPMVTMDPVLLVGMLCICIYPLLVGMLCICVACFVCRRTIWNKRSIPKPAKNVISCGPAAFTLQGSGGGSTPVTSIPLPSAHLAFQTAVKVGDLDKVRAVHADVGNAIDVNFNDPNNGRTFLHWAAFYGHASVAMFLLELGANKDIEGLGGATPLHLAAQEGRVEIVTLLLAKGADKNKANTRGATALSFAARHGHLSVVQCLLDHGVAKDQAILSSGDTPLHLAAERGHLDVVTCLIDYGAEKDICNHHGKTPMSRAFKYSHGSLLAYFKSLELAVPVISMRLHVPSGTAGSKATKIYLNPSPSISQFESDELTNGDVVDVYNETIQGFYKLVDGRGYVMAAYFIDATTNGAVQPLLFCPNKHSLSFVLPSNSRCDMCRSDVASTGNRWCCNDCGHDICDYCARKQFQQSPLVNVQQWANAAAAKAQNIAETARTNYGKSFFRFLSTRNGVGVRKYANSDDEYAGEFMGAKCHGHGMFKWSNGDSFAGEYKNGLVNGYGVVKGADGTSYEGEWKKHKKHGRGVYKWANGDSYEGEWKDGKQHGHGVKRLANGTVVHDGEWKDDKPV